MSSQWVRAERLATVIFLTVRAALAQGPAYTVPFPMSTSTTGAEAIASLPNRIKPVVQRSACGSEFDFLSFLLHKNTGEDPLSNILAKMAWATGLQQGVSSTPSLEICTETRHFSKDYLSAFRLRLSGQTYSGRYQAQSCPKAGT